VDENVPICHHDHVPNADGNDFLYIITCKKQPGKKNKSDLTWKRLIENQYSVVYWIDPLIGISKFHIISSDLGNIFGIKCKKT